MTAAAVVELLHDAFIEEFNERRAEAYFSRFMETGDPWTFETLSKVTIEVTEARTTLPRKHCSRITRLAHEVAEWMGGPAGSDKYALCVSYTDAGRAAASTAAAVLTNESVGPRRGQGDGELASLAEVEPLSAVRVTPDQLGLGRNHTAEAQLGEHATQATLGVTASPLEAAAVLPEDRVSSQGVATARAQVGVQAAHGAAPASSTNSEQHQQPAQQAQQDVQQEMIGALKQRSFSPAIVGYETQWLAAAVDALARLEDELKLSDIQQHYKKQCAADRELFMREWQRKSIGILAHRKRKLKNKTK